MILLGRSPGHARLHRLLTAHLIDGDGSDSQGERAMYCNFLGLQCRPFEDRTDTRFLSLSSKNELLLEALEHEAHQGRGVTPVFGEAGSGKTLLTRALVARLHASDHVVVITCPRSGTIDLLSEVCRGFGVTISPSEGRSKYTERLRKHLARNAKVDHRSILIVDQVEHLTADNLGAVSTLGDIHDDNGRLLMIFLFGQPHVRAMLNEPQFAPLAQQLAGAHTIEALDRSETKAYIEHRLAIAGSADPALFDEGAVALIHAAAKGNPRLINRLCHAALLNAYRADERRVGEKVAASVTTDYAGKARSIPSVIPEGTFVDSKEPVRAPVGYPESERSRSIRTEGRASQSPSSNAEFTASTPSPSSLRDKDRSVSTGPVEPNMPAMTTELGIMIGRGEALMHRLELQLPRADAESNGGGQNDGLAQDAENRLIALLERVERTCDRADQAETRLSGFAEKLAEQAEIVQKRIGHLMTNLQDGETLRDEIQQTIQKTSSEATATSEEIEKQKQALETAMRDAGKLRADLVSEVCDACRTKINDDFQEKRHAYDEMTQQARRQLQEVADELVGQVREVQAQARCTIQSFDDRIASAKEGERERADSIEKRLGQSNKDLDDQIDRANLTRTGLMDTQCRGENLLRETQAATGQIESLMHNVSRTLMDIGSACERVGQAREQLQSAEQVTARLTAAVDSGERVDGKLGDATAKAADLRDAIMRTTAEVETKISQLGSHAAASTHLLGELHEANIEGHRLIEQSAKAINETRETSQNTKLETERLIKEVWSLTSKTEAAANEMAAGNEHGLQLMKRLEKVIRVAGELTGKMTVRTNDAKQSAKALDEHCTRAETLVERIGDTTQLLEGARQVETNLEKSLDQARAIESELKSTADDATLKQAQLATDKKAACELIEVQERLAEQSQDSIARLDEGIADAQSTTEASQQLLDQFTRHGKTLHDVLETLGRRTTQLEESLDEMTKRPAAIVVDAQVQSAQLEHVCAAVGKIFAELSKASLEAHEQTKECHQASQTAFEQLEQLRRETDGTSRSLQTWLEHTLRVGSDLAQSLGSARTNFETPPAHEQAVSSSQNAQAVRIANRRTNGEDLPKTGVAEAARPLGEPGGAILKTAEAPRSIENPAALSMTRKPTREQEIAGMIADAKAAETAKP